ncbi:hypothetical protein [Coleofasciculus sp. F4-SAH-05]|uniref:hypothetical protein n=1 Tax=Coleofasciculus sp. F4-SAH-05 TaxID=3069525 RepID=UPI0033033BF2
MPRFAQNFSQLENRLLICHWSDVLCSILWQSCCVSIVVSSELILALSLMTND